MTVLGTAAPVEFQQVLRQRDTVITFLARNDPGSAAVLLWLHADFKAGLRSMPAQSQDRAAIEVLSSAPGSQGSRARMSE